MLTIYAAQTAHLAAEKVISEIGKEGKHIVIAPDAFTVAVEKAISDKLGKKGFFNVEVMSFARLASVLLGEGIKKCLSPSGSVMLMEKVIRREAKNLLHYHKAAGSVGFASEIYAAITSIRNSGVTPEDLFAIEGSIRKEYIRRKTHDIAHLYSEYLKELAIDHTDSTTRLEALAMGIRNSESESADGESIGDTTFHIVDHIDLNAKQLDVVAALMTKAKGVVVAVPNGKGALNERVYPKLLDKLRRKAEGEGVLPKEIFVPTTLSAEKKKLADELFSYSFSKGKAASVALYEAKDAEEEVILLATEIVRSVRREGRRYNDFAVITPSFEEYLPILERIFDRYEIPFFSDRRVPLSSSDLFRHVLLAMEIPLGKYDKKLVLKYVLHALFDATAEEKAAFSDYIDKSGVDHTLFTQPFSLFPEDSLYPVAEKVRETLSREISFFGSCPEEATVREYADLLLAYLAKEDYDAKVKNYYEGVLAADLREKAEILRQVPQAMSDLLSELVELRGEERVSTADFIAALKAGAGQVKIASLPVSLDCVYFAPVEQAMYAPIHALYVLGAEEGLFPLEKMGEGILGSAEYTEWQMNDVVIENTGVEELAESRFHALQLLLRGEKVYLSYTESANCSPCIRQMLEIFDDLIVKKCAEALDEYDVGVRIPTRRVAEIFLIDSSRKYREGILSDRERLYALAIADILGVPFPSKRKEDHVKCLSEEVNPFFRGGVTSVSALESYFTCPFMHFVKYGLGAKRKDKVTFDGGDVGNLLHEFLKRFLSYLKKAGFELSDEDARKKAKEIVEEMFTDPKYTAVAMALGKRLLPRVKRRAETVAIVVKNHLSVTDFRPALLEKSFPDRSAYEWKSPQDDPLPTLSTLSLEGVSLTGRIDRVDVLRGEKGLSAVAYDYKSGNGDISTDDLYVGKKIQLHVYLAVLEASGYTPSAALYFALVERLKNDKQILHGPKKAEIISSLEKDISSIPSPYTGVYEKEGELTEDQGLLLSDEIFRAQIEYACLVATQAIKEIKEGYVLSTPLGEEDHLPCKYCDAVTVCRHRGERRRSAKSVTAEAIYEVTKAVKGEGEENGKGKNDGTTAD